MNAGTACVHALEIMQQMKCRLPAGGISFWGLIFLVQMDRN
jgi:hypothetical protein